MKRISSMKVVSLGLLLAVAAGLFLVLPGSLARARTTEVAFDYCDVSGITAPEAANGHYVRTGSVISGEPIFTKGSYVLGYLEQSMASAGSPFPFLWIRTFTVAPSEWQIRDGSTVMFINENYSFNPPASGWFTAVEMLYGEDGLNVTCGMNASPSSPGVPEPIKSPITYVLGDAQQVTLSCRKTLSYGLLVPGGDLALLNCPISGLAANDKKAQEDLPAPVTGGSFVSAFELRISGGGTPLSTVRTPWIVAFRIPEGVPASQLAILFWDAAENQWVELPAAVNLLTDPITSLGDGRKVFVGTHQYTRTHVAATVNFTGLFVLIQK